MRHIYGISNIKLLDKSIVILGNFDGIHIGHQELFSLAREVADKQGLKTVLFSFYPHPTWVLGNRPKSLLMSREEKRDRVKELGIDIYIEYPFTIDFAKMRAIDFIEKILVNQLNCKAVTVGGNFYFGQNKEGNISLLKEYGERYGFDLYVVNEIKDKDIVISSSLIRKLILEGKIQLANKLIGNPYSIKGKIIRGNQLGRTLGFPTANILPHPRKLLPPNGAYVTRVDLLGNQYFGLTNIGYNPTVNGQKKMVETYIFNFSNDVYGEIILIEILKYIRPEIKFKNVQELTRQLEKDRRLALKYIEEI